ncbi:MAG: hypothetical protein LBC84_03945 [Prevotellaceae bacterium]|jgi:hypothetical protein|nr:hypothetical protein [Prevotellaceae bacterium]
MKKIISLITYLIIAVTAVVTVYFLLALSSDGDVQRARAGIFLSWAGILLVAGALLAIILPLIDILSNPKGLKKMALNIGFIVVVFCIAFLLASGSQTPSTLAMPDVPSTQIMKLTDMGLKTTYLLFGISLLAIVFSSVLNTIRNR